MDPEFCVQELFNIGIALKEKSVDCSQRSVSRGDEYYQYEKNLENN